MGLFDNEFMDAIALLTNFRFPVTTVETKKDDHVDSTVENTVTVNVNDSESSKKSEEEGIEPMTFFAPETSGTQTNNPEVAHDTENLQKTIEEMNNTPASYDFLKNVVADTVPPIENVVCDTPACKEQNSADLYKETSNITKKPDSFINSNFGTIGCKDDSVKYKVDEQRKVKPKEQTDEGLNFSSENIPKEGDLMKPLSEKRALKPLNMTEIVDNNTEAENYIDLLENNNPPVPEFDDVQRQFSFMEDIGKIANDCGYTLGWDIDKSAWGFPKPIDNNNRVDMIYGRLFNPDFSPTNKFFAIDVRGVIYNPIMKIFMLDDPKKAIETFDGYPVYIAGNGQTTLNRKVIGDLFTGGDKNADSREACYKGTDKVLNAFVDVADLRRQMRRQDARNAVQRLKAAVSKGVFAPSSAWEIQSNRFGLSKINAQNDFELTNNFPLHYDDDVRSCKKIVIHFKNNGTTEVKA